MLQALIFDIGNVLLHFDFKIARQRLDGLCDRFEEQSWQSVERLKALCEAGAISREDFEAGCVEILGFRGDPRLFTTIWQEIFTLNQPMADFVYSVHGRLPLYLLSNTSAIHVEYMLREYPIFTLFEDAIYSHEVRVAKPDPAIFNLAIQKFQVDPDQTAYIDDLLDNIKSARAAGFRGLHYDTRGHDLFLSEVGPLL